MNASVIFLEPKGTILEVIRAAHKRGYKVVTISSDPELLRSVPAPYDTAVALIDRKLEVGSWSDADSVLQTVENIHREWPVAGVYNGVDPCAHIATRLRRAYGLPTPHPNSMKIILNKFLLRRKLVESGLSRLSNIHSSEIDSVQSWPFDGAAYFKPVHGFFSAYVQRCASLENVKAATETWKTGVSQETPFVRNYIQSVPEFHVEEAIEGELMSVEGISSGGKFTSLGLLSRILYSKNPIVEMGSCFPYPHPQAEQIIEKVRAAHYALGFTDGPSHTEVIVSQAGDIEIIDLNPRFVGADVLQSINHAYAIWIEEALLDFAVGITPSIIPAAKNFSCIQYVLPPEINEFESLEFPSSPEVKFVASFLPPGTILKTRDRQLDYLGCYLTVMPTFELATARSRELREQVRVNQNHKGAF